MIFNGCAHAGAARLSQKAEDAAVQNITFAGPDGLQDIFLLIERANGRIIHIGATSWNSKGFQS